MQQYAKGDSHCNCFGEGDNVSELEHQTESGARPKSSDRKSPPAQKMPTLKGRPTYDWRAFHVHFDHIAKSYKWDSLTKLERLVELWG